MMLMKTYGILEIIVNERKWRINGKTVWFKYTEIVWNHYTYQHSVEIHNNRRQSPISIEKTCSTSYCTNRVFSLLFGVIEVNILLEPTKIYSHKPMETLEFQKKIETSLLNNTCQLAEK